jgi:hypothetical protein
MKSDLGDVNLKLSEKKSEIQNFRQTLHSIRRSL